MERKKVCCALLVAVLAVLAAPLHAQQEPKPLDGFEFVDRDYAELFYALSLYSGIAITGDDTVRGTASFRFAGTDFEGAFDSFLASRRLYATKTPAAWTVSRIRLRQADDASWELDANDVPPARILESLSRQFRVQVTYEGLPDQAISLHAQGDGAVPLAQAVVRQLGADYALAESDGTVHIRRAATQSRVASGSARNFLVTQKDGLYSVDVENVPLGDVLERLFTLAAVQFVFVADVQQSVRRMVLREKTLGDALSLVCSEHGVSVAEQGGICYVVPAESDGSARVAGMSWRRYDLAFVQPERVISLASSLFGSVQAVPLAQEKAFLCLASDAMHGRLSQFVASVDVSVPVHVVRLQYITVDTLLSHLPPQVPQSCITRTPDDSTCFFTGSQREFDYFSEVLRTADVPARQIRYDVLIVQYQNTKVFSWQSALSAGKVSLGDVTDASALLGSVLSLNMNVVAAFGLQFASSLQSALSKNQAAVFADTTLHGVSGGTISFRNTSTYRYRDNNVDPETGKPLYTGITRELVSGLRLDITGWVSGDGMITSDITASVSRQGADLSGKTGNPPPTSEKTVTTKVRAKSGEPIVLSGLIQEEETVTEQGVPVLSRIPLVGMLFKSKAKTTERTEMVIYLVPHWVTGAEQEPVEQVSAQDVLAEFLSGLTGGAE